MIYNTKIEKSIEITPTKYLFIDSRMRNVEKETLKNLGYELALIPKNARVYEEISSHTDIFIANINGKLVIEPTLYKFLKEEKEDFFGKVKENIICGKSLVDKKYPLDIAYNVCFIGKNAIHNFKYTDENIQELIEKEDLNKINISQGYSNCAIAVIDENSAIVEDKKIAEVLRKNNIEVLEIERENTINLLDGIGTYSRIKGFIGGTISKIGKNVVIFGDLNYFKNSNKIREFILKKDLKIIDFKNLDLIDYGGVIEI